MQSSSFAWYGVIEAAESLEQGDIIFNVPVLETDLDTFENKEKSEGASQQGDFEFQTYDLIVMTHSCDFVNFTDESRIIFCPLRSYSEFRDTPPPAGKEKNQTGKH